MLGIIEAARVNGLASFCGLFVEKVPVTKARLG